MQSTISRGNIVLVKFPFTDQTGALLRPALVVSDGQIGQDVILSAISSTIRQEPTDYTIDTNHPEFILTKLNTKSTFRLHKLATVDRALITRRLGHIGPSLQAEVNKILRRVVSGSE